MNCRRITELMPLLVEKDLPDAAMQEASRHLSDCETCSALLHDYAASQSWLHTQALPEFDAAFYLNLQRDVMQEIARRPSRLSVFHRLTEALRWRRGWALAMLLVLLVGAIAFFIYAKQPKPDATQEQVIVKPPPEKRQDAPPLPKEERENLSQNFTVVKQPKKPLRQKRERTLPWTLPSVKPELTHPKEVIAANQTTGGIEKSPINTGDIEVFFDTLQMTRMELQTADPNIRIIWFAPKMRSSQALKLDTE